MAKIGKIEQKAVLDNPTLEEQHSFYEAYYSHGLQIRFNKLRIVNLLREMGFYRYDIPESHTSEMVRIVENKIRIVSLTTIRDAFEDYLMGLQPIERTFYTKGKSDSEDEPSKVTVQITSTILIGKMYDNLQNLFSADLMERLRPINYSITIEEDNYNTKYVFFNNTAVEVTAEGIKLVPYSSLKNYIWENAIINRDFEEDCSTGDFEQFICDICKYNEKTKEGQARKKSLMSLLGYLMHNNYETNLKAIMFTDVNEEGGGVANGGTGKGILGKALAQMLNRQRGDCRYLVVAGKGFEFKDTRYAGGDLTTQLIHIEDLDKRFSFTDLFCDVTDGCTFRKLHHNPQIHFSKIMLSVNHTINFQGTSERRRLVIFELYNYYSEKFTPVDKFGKRFFESQWTQKDWSQFYNFMLRCVAVYMQYGIIEPDMVNYEQRLIEEQLPEDFVYFFEQEIKESVAHQTRTEYVKKNLYDRFIFKYPQYTKYNQSGFTKWCTLYLQLRHIRSGSHRKKQNNDYTDIFVLYPDIHENLFKYIVK